MANLPHPARCLVETTAHSTKGVLHKAQEMNLSVLAYLLVTERHRQRAAPAGGFSVPFMSEREVPPETEPLLVTNARGGFVQTRRSHEGVARFGFSACPLESEPILLGRLYDALASLSAASGWMNRFNTMAAAIDFMRASPCKPKNLVISEDSGIPVFHR